MATYKITLACDQHEGEEFAAWLNAQGHAVELGCDTCTYTDGVRTSTNEDASEIMRNLWVAYCNAA